MYSALTPSGIITDKAVPTNKPAPNVLNKRVRPWKTRSSKSCLQPKL